MDIIQTDKFSDLLSSELPALLDKNISIFTKGFLHKDTSSNKVYFRYSFHSDELSDPRIGPVARRLVDKKLFVEDPVAQGFVISRTYEDFIQGRLEPMLGSLKPKRMNIYLNGSSEELPDDLIEFKALETELLRKLTLGNFAPESHSFQALPILLDKKLKGSVYLIISNTLINDFSFLSYNKYKSAVEFLSIAFKKFSLGKELKLQSMKSIVPVPGNYFYDM